MASKTELKILVWVLILNYPIKLTTAPCNRTCRTYPNTQKCLELKCRKRSDSMFHVDVRSSKTSNGQCNGSAICTGIQPGVFTVVADDCYWHRRCYIPLNSNFPILNNDEMCTSISRPQVLETRALCVKTRKILSFYAIRSPVRQKEGIVKISDLFPWEYSTNIIFHRIKFKAKSNKKLRISFLKVDLDVARDYLTLSDGQTSLNVSEQSENANLDFPTGDVNMEFNVGSTSRRGGGFVLCFLWLGRGNSRQGNACDLIRGVKCGTMSATVTDPPCDQPRPGQRNRSRGRRN